LAVVHFHTFAVESSKKEMTCFLLMAMAVHLELGNHYDRNPKPLEWVRLVVQTRH